MKVDVTCSQRVKPGEIWTAQMALANPLSLDITVKGRSPFGPSWDMVMDHKNGRITDAQYTSAYLLLMGDRLYRQPRQWETLREQIPRTGIVLKCYCPRGNFCHRTLLAQMLTQFGWGTYRGEMTR